MVSECNGLQLQDKCWGQRTGQVQVIFYVKLIISRRPIDEFKFFLRDDTRVIISPNFKQEKVIKLKTKKVNAGKWQ